MHVFIELEASYYTSRRKIQTVGYFNEHEVVDKKQKHTSGVPLYKVRNP